MVETIATLITVFCGIFSMIIAACTIQAPYSKTVANVLKTLFIISTISGGMPSDAFPSIKWEDSEPTRVCIRIAQYDNQKKLFKQYTHKHQ